MEDLNVSMNQYKEQLAMVNQALENVTEENEKESLVTLQSDLNQLIQLTQESLDSLQNDAKNGQNEGKTELDDEYALFMAEMATTGAYDSETQQKESESSTSKTNEDKTTDVSDIEDELANLLGMKCAVYHTHKWGGQPTLHNAMVSAVIPRQEDDEFKDLQVRVLFTHPTHTEMLPCPFYLEGECKFNDEQCRYSHGAVTHLSNLKEAIEPSFSTLKPGSRVLMKLQPPDDEDISVTKKSTEKYHLWHRAVVKSIDSCSNTCSVKLEHGVKTGNKRKSTAEHIVRIEDTFPLNNEDESESLSDNSLSDTEYPDTKFVKKETDYREALIESSLQMNTPAMGEWEKHTRGIGSKLMIAMGYIPGTGLGAASDGRVAPVEARLLPTGKSLDQCMAITEKYGEDALMVEQRLKRLQKKEEERNKKAYEREKERERRNVFNFLNRTLGDYGQEATTSVASIDIKQSTSKDLNIEQFKVTEETRKLERELLKLNSSLTKHPPGSSAHITLITQIADKNKELSTLRQREQHLSREQKQRKDKEKMTVF